MQRDREGELGVLWIKTSPKGGTYFTGYVEIDGKRTNLVVFANNHKKEEKHPAYQILKAKSKEEVAATKAPVRDETQDNQEKLSNLGTEEGRIEYPEEIVF